MKKYAKKKSSKKPYGNVGVSANLLFGQSTDNLSEVNKIKFNLFRQWKCTHEWKRDATFRQLKKDDDKLLWICRKCDMKQERDRWNPPEGAKK